MYLFQFLFPQGICLGVGFLGHMVGGFIPNGTPLQYSCLENPREGGAWWAAVYGVAESDTTEAT